MYPYSDTSLAVIILDAWVLHHKSLWGRKGIQGAVFEQVCAIGPIFLPQEGKRQLKPLLLSLPVATGMLPWAPQPLTSINPNMRFYIQHNFETNTLKTEGSASKQVLATWGGHCFLWGKTLLSLGAGSKDRLNRTPTLKAPADNTGGCILIDLFRKPVVENINLVAPDI